MPRVVLSVNAQLITKTVELTPAFTCSSGLCPCYALSTDLRYRWIALRCRTITRSRYHPAAIDRSHKNRWMALLCIAKAAQISLRNTYVYLLPIDGTVLTTDSAVGSVNPFSPPSPSMVARTSDRPTSQRDWPIAHPWPSIRRSMNLWQINASNIYVEKYIHWVTTLSLTIRVFLHSFGSWCFPNLRNPSKFPENSIL